METREETYAAIRKALATLDDPFTRLLDPARFKALQRGTAGSVTGVGLEVGFVNQGNAADSELVVRQPSCEQVCRLWRALLSSVWRHDDVGPTFGAQSS